ncbi:unnamed protein product [Cunninghamella blakesleeana]
MQSTFIRGPTMAHMIYSQQLIQPKRNYCWKPNIISNMFIIERPHSDDFLFYTEANTEYKVTFPNSKTNSNRKYSLNEVKASYRTRQYQITNVKDPLVTTSKIPLYPFVDVVKENKFKYVKKNNHTSTVSPPLPPSLSHENNNKKNKNAKYHHHYQEKQQNPTNYTQSTTFNNNNNNRIKQSQQRLYISTNKNTSIPDTNYYTNNSLNNLPFYHHQQQYSQSPYIIPSYNYSIQNYQYYYYYGNPQQQQPIINEINNEKDNQRRISTNTVDSASTTTNYDFKPRRFSSGSTSSSKSTILSSMESLTTKMDDSTGLEIEKCKLTNNNMEKSAASNSPTDKVDAQTNKNNDDDEYSILQQQQQQQQQLHEDDNTSYKSVTFASTLDVIISTDNNNINLSNEVKKEIENKLNTDINNSNNNNHIENGNNNVNQYSTVSSPTSSTSTSSTLSSSIASISKSSSSSTATTNTTALTSTSITTTTNDLELPIWADPIKVKENPTRYKEVQDYMMKNHIPYTSVLPLPKQVIFYFGDTSKTKSGEDDYRSTMDTLFTCKTIWEYSARWRRYKEVYDRKPSRMSINQNLYCFHKGVEPMWEDETNKDGGRLTLCPARGQLDELFDWLLCSFAGGSLLTFGMVGIVFSRRARADRIELWLDASANTDVLSKLR